MSNAIYHNLDGSIGQDITDLGNTFASATLSGGAITYSATLMSVDTAGGAPVGELNTIANGGTGKLLLLRNQSTARAVIVKHETGNIWSASGDVMLTNPNQLIMLVYNASKWVVIGAGVGGATGGEPPPEGACEMHFHDVDNPTVGGASWSGASAITPFGWITTTGGAQYNATGGHNGAECYRSQAIGWGRECTIVATLPAACTVTSARFWYYAEGSDGGVGHTVAVRLYDADKALIGSTHYIWNDPIRVGWHRGVWTGTEPDVKYVVFSNVSGNAGNPQLRLDEFEINT